MENRKINHDKQSSGIDKPFNYILLTGASLFFWITAYLMSTGYPAPVEASDAPLWTIICRALTNKNGIYAAGLLLIGGGGFLIHRINYVLVIIREKTWMPFLLYVLLTSASPNFSPLHYTSIGMFFLILAFYQLFTSYHDREAIGRTFNMGLFIGIGSLLWIHLLWLLPIFWIGMYNFKTMTLRTFLASFAGAGLAYWFLLGWCVWRHDYTLFAIPFASILDAGLPFSMDGLRLEEWAYILYVGGLTIMAIGNMSLHEYDDDLRTRRFLSFLILLLTASFILFLVYRQSANDFLDMACLPVSILIAHFFVTKKGKKRVRLAYILILLLILISLMRSPWIYSLNTVI
jgi:hypothetical protein